MKNSFLEYAKKRKNTPLFRVIKFILRNLLYPLSNIHLIIFQESILRKTLRIKAIKEFWFSDEIPKYSDLRTSHFLSNNNRFPLWLSRGFYSRQSIKKGDKVLDIGCGNGFVTCFFLSDICLKIDAIDINGDAIKSAKKYHYSKNINYHILNAVSENFPNSTYDVIIMDSSIMYIKESDIDTLLNKIQKSMHDNSLFVGSATLGSLENSNTGDMQLSNKKELEVILNKYFSNIKIWSQDEMGFERIYFRCMKTNTDKLNPQF